MAILQGQNSIKRLIPSSMMSVPPSCIAFSMLTVSFMVGYPAVTNVTSAFLPAEIVSFCYPKLITLLLAFSECLSDLFCHSAARAFYA